MQRVQGADAKGGSISPGEIDAGIPNLILKLSLQPDSLRAVLCEITPGYLSLDTRKLAEKDT